MKKILLVCLVLILGYQSVNFWSKLLILNLGRAKLSQAYISPNLSHNDYLLSAEKFLASVQVRWPDDQAILTELGKVKLLKHDFKGAEMGWRGGNYTFDHSYFLHRLVLRAGERNNELERSCKLAASLWPDFPHAYLRLGRFYIETQNYTQATIHLKEATESRFVLFFPYEHTRSNYLLARSYHTLGELEKAEIYYQYTVDIDPNNHWLWFTIRAHIYLGDLHLKSSNYEQAAQDYANAYLVSINDNQQKTALAKMELLLAKSSNRKRIQHIIGELLHE